MNAGEKASSKIGERQLNARFDHKKYGIKPSHGVFAQHPMVNDELPNRIISGTIQLKPNIKKFTENTVIFDNGRSVDLNFQYSVLNSNLNLQDRKLRSMSSFLQRAISSGFRTWRKESST